MVADPHLIAIMASDGISVSNNVSDQVGEAEVKGDILNI
jgi:hypothetical protein